MHLLPTKTSYTQRRIFLKHNFDENFDIPIFQGETTKVQQMKGGKILYDKKFNIIRDAMAITKVGTYPAFKQKYNLLSTSKLHKYVDFFLPLNKTQQELFPDEPNNPKFEGDFES